MENPLFTLLTHPLSLFTSANRMADPRFVVGASGAALPIWKKQLARMDPWNWHNHGGKWASIANIDAVLNANNGSEQKKLKIRLAQFIWHQTTV